VTRSAGNGIGARAADDDSVLAAKADRTRIVGTDVKIKTSGREAPGGLDQSGADTDPHCASAMTVSVPGMSALRQRSRHQSSRSAKSIRG
jgi:hypothetical protein